MKTAPKTMLFRVEYVPKSPNRLLRQHWSVSMRHKKQVRQAWRCALLLSPYAKDFSTLTTMLSQPVRD